MVTKRQVVEERHALCNSLIQPCQLKIKKIYAIYLIELNYYITEIKKGEKRRNGRKKGKKKSRVPNNFEGDMSIF